MTLSWSFILQLLQWCTVQWTLDIKYAIYICNWKVLFKISSFFYFFIYFLIPAFQLYTILFLSEIILAGTLLYNVTNITNNSRYSQHPLLLLFCHYTFIYIFFWSKCVNLFYFPISHDTRQSTEINFSHWVQ